MHARATTIILTLALAAPVHARQGEAGPAAARQAAGTAPAVTDAQTPPAAQTSAFTAEQLEQLVAPIALYPDGLLTQILMASTYPLEVVEAARWVKQNPGAKGEKLEAALKEQTWDPSVKSVCGFPDVLARMNDNLDWTQDLGDAFLGQRAELMDTVQQMRRKAYEAGTLKTTKEQTVTEQDPDIIVVESADPEVIYVPTYYPTAVYGSWSYPHYYYPPMYPPAPAGGMFFSFSAGVVWGAAIWGDCDWGNSDVNIDIDRENTFIDRTEVDARRQQVKDKASTSDGRFQHDPQHRKGVGYKDGQVAQRYGASGGQTRVSRDQARGYAERGGATRPSTTDRAAGAGSSSRERPATRPSTGDANRLGGSAGSAQRAQTPRSSGLGSSSFSGSRSPSMDRAGSARGASSRGSGGARGGGSRGGGRGRR